MTLARLLDIRPGVTAVIGSGGKTTLLRMLGEELAEAGGRVLLCTTTKILPFPGLPCACDRAELDDLAASRLLCAGMPLENGKLTVPEIPMAELAARFDYVLVEADGSARLPLKAHASHEPVIPPEARSPAPRITTNISFLPLRPYGRIHQNKRRFSVTPLPRAKAGTPRTGGPTPTAPACPPG